MNDIENEAPVKEGIAYRFGWRSYHITRGEFKSNPFTEPVGRERWEQGWADARELEYEERCR